MDFSDLTASGIVAIKVLAIFAVALLGGKLWAVLENLAGSITDTRWRNIALTIVHAIQQQYESLAGTEKADLADKALAKFIKDADERKLYMEAAVSLMKASQSSEATKVAAVVTSATVKDVATVVADAATAAASAANTAQATIDKAEALAAALRGDVQ